MLHEQTLLHAASFREADLQHLAAMLNQICVHKYRKYVDEGLRFVDVPPPYVQFVAVFVLASEMCAACILIPAVRLSSEDDHSILSWNHCHHFLSCIVGKKQLKRAQTMGWQLCT